MTTKKWLSLDEQVDLLIERGLVVNDQQSCRSTLQRIGYYHLSGYGRFFQVDPVQGDNSFRAGTTFEAVAELQNLDSRLRHLCLEALAPVELAIRTGFAYRFAEMVGTYGSILESRSFHPGGPRSRAVHEIVRADLDRSSQAFIVRHRISDGTYPTLPVWAAVEVLSMGTLSKAIELGTVTAVGTAMADDMNLPRVGFSSQVRSFVALRNSCAHMSRLWNDVAKNPPAVAPKIVHRAKTRVGQFEPQSYFYSFVALDRFVTAVVPQATFIADVEKLMDTNVTFKQGLLLPRPY